jgi:hypothetical protein
VLPNGRTVVRVRGRVVGWVDDRTAVPCAHPRCRKATAEGRPWHAIPRYGRAPWPTYHFATAEAAVQAIVDTYRREGR